MASLLSTEVYGHGRANWTDEACEQFSEIDLALGSGLLEKTLQMRLDSSFRHSERPRRITDASTFDDGRKDA
jgi:hypothetical protein